MWMFPKVMAEHWMLTPVCRMRPGVGADVSPGVPALLLLFWRWDYSSLRLQAAALLPCLPPALLRPDLAEDRLLAAGAAPLSLLGPPLPAEGKRCPR